MGIIADARAESHERFRLILLAQLPMLAVLVALTVILGFIEPAAIADPVFIAGATLAVLASVAAVIVRWSSVRQTWIVLVPLADIIVVALAREGLHVTTGTLPAFGALIIFPVLWLATELSVLAVPAVFVSTAAVVGLPFLLKGLPPKDPVEWFNLTLVPIAMSCVALAAGSVTRRMRADRQRADELALRLQDSLTHADDREATLRSVTETVEAAIIMFDLGGRIVLSNGTARQFFHLVGADDNGTLTGPALLFEEDRSTPVPLGGTIVRKTMVGNELAGRIYWLGPSGAQRAVTVSSRRVTRPDGAPLGTVVVGYDVTPLVESIEVRDAFLASVSHELKTPLTNIIGYLDLLDDEQSSAEITVIRKNAERLLSLVVDLLTGTGATQQLHRIPVDVTSVAEAAVTDIHLRAQSAGLRVRLRRGPRVIAEVDREGMRRVLDHLLSNAVKYSTAGGTVVVAVTTEGSSAIITVEDNGIGISAEHRNQVFDRFFRAPRARSQAISGTGLGLAIVRALVEAHDGTVQLASEVGVGTIFTIRLPLRAMATLG